MLQLPVPIIGSIFKHLDFKQILRNRLVCKDLDILIKKSMHFYQIEYNCEMLTDDQIDIIKNARFNISINGIKSIKILLSSTLYRLLECNIRIRNFMISDYDSIKGISGRIVKKLVQTGYPINKFIANTNYDKRLFKWLSVMDAKKIYLSFVQSSITRPSAFKLSHPTDVRKYLTKILNHYVGKNLRKFYVSQTKFPSQGILQILKNNPQINDIGFCYLETPMGFKNNIVPHIDYLSNYHTTNIKCIDLSGTVIPRQVFILLANKKYGYIKKIVLNKCIYEKISGDEICYLFVNQINGYLEEISFDLDDTLTDVGLVHLSCQIVPIKRVHIDNCEQVTLEGETYLHSVTCCFMD